MWTTFLSPPQATPLPQFVKQEKKQKLSRKQKKLQKQNPNLAHDQPYLQQQQHNQNPHLSQSQAHQQQQQYRQANPATSYVPPTAAAQMPAATATTQTSAAATTQTTATTTAQNLAATTASLQQQQVQHHNQQQFTAEQINVFQTLDSAKNLCSAQNPSADQTAVDNHLLNCIKSMLQGTGSKDTWNRILQDYKQYLQMTQQKSISRTPAQSSNASVQQPATQQLQGKQTAQIFI